MFKKGIEGFPYYMGVNSLADIATGRDRVCVLNILGGESKTVTPISHAFSGGNVAFGTSPGRLGQVLATPVGDIPSSTSAGAWTRARLQHWVSACRLRACRRRRRAVSVNPLGKERHPDREGAVTTPARNPRAGQSTASTSSAANCLGIADSWNRRAHAARWVATTRESLFQGSVALLPTPGAAPPPSRSTWPWKAGARRR